MKIILASSSPRRQELLKTAGVHFDVLPINIDESRHKNETATAYIQRMVHTKADQACQLIDNQPALVLTADTIGVLKDGSILTKPTDKNDALMMWDKLSDNTHEIWTAVCASFIKAHQIHQQKTIQLATEVKFIALSQAQKEKYWQTGEPLDKAGAYAIQGGAMAWVESIHGSYSNVVGLPLAQTLNLIHEMTKNLK